MCEKITAYENYLISPSVGFDCVCMFIANSSEEKKLIAVLCKQNVLVEVYSTLSHISCTFFFLFHSSHAEKTINVFIIVYLSSII